MEIKQGYSYHIKDSFFSNVQDASLMSNKDDGNYRPHYYAIKEAIAIMKNGKKIFYADIAKILEVIKC